MATPPVFSAGAVLTAAQMNAVGLWRVVPTVSGTGVTVDSTGLVTLTAAAEPYITCFSADFVNYRIICDITAHSGAAQSLIARMANGTTPNNTAADYRYVLSEQTYATGAFVTASNNGGSAFLTVGRVENNKGNFVMDIMNPYATAITYYVSQYTDEAVSGRDGGRMNVTTSYNTINLRLNGTNTLTGTVRVYGYN